MRFNCRNPLSVVIFVIFQSMVLPFCFAEDAKPPSVTDSYDREFVRAVRELRTAKEYGPRSKNIMMFEGSIAIADASSPEDAFLKFLQRHGKSYELPQNLDNFQVVQNSTDKFGTSLRYRQMFQDLPVFDTALMASVMKKDVYEIFSAAIRDYSMPETIDIPTNPDPVKAIAAATEAIRQSYTKPPESVLFRDWDKPKSELGIFVHRGVAKVAWHITAKSENHPSAAWDIYVDATTNEVLSIRNITIVS